MSYSTLETPAPGLRVLAPSAWAVTWEGRPRRDVAVGLRPLAAGECVELRQLAAQSAWEKHPDPHEADDLRLAAYNDALMRYVVSRGTCDPNDASKALELWQDVGDALVFDALPDVTVRFLFDAIEQTALETCPTAREATDTEVATLAERLAKATLTPALEGNVRRLLARVGDLLGEATKAR